MDKIKEIEKGHKRIMSGNVDSPRIQELEFMLQIEIAKLLTLIHNSLGDQKAV